MIAEVKADRISVVIIKDMSRFGRDYLQVGTYMEVLRKHDTRLIALNDSVDTLKGDDEFTPFRNIMNEWYARDTSKKIRSAFQAKNLAGKHTSSSVPYGYLKSEQDKNQWVIDPVAAPIVQRIYRMTMEGKGPYQIAAILSAEHIEIPAYYHQKLGIGLWQTREIRDPYKWGSSTIVHILTNPCYLVSCSLHDFTAETSDAAFSLFPFLPCAIIVFGLLFALAVTRFGKKEMR